jgi:hypothetical protein
VCATRNIPDPEWLRLGEARAKAIAFFADAQPAAIEAALVRAFFNGKVKTEGKCLAWYTHDTRVAVEDHVWDPDRVRVGWTLDPDLDCFERTFEGKQFLFVEVYVNCRDLDRWLAAKQAADHPEPSGEGSDRGADADESTGELAQGTPRRRGGPRPTAPQIGGTIVQPGATKNRPGSRNRGPRPKKYEAVLKAMKKSISDKKHTTELLKDSTEESLAMEFKASRTTIRKAREKILSSSQIQK